jgi:bifunctional DNase/RNase
MIDDEALVPVVLLALIEETVLRSPVVILHDPVSNQVLPIWVGESEARAIGMAYQGVKTPRPLTHEKENRSAQLNWATHPF